MRVVAVVDVLNGVLDDIPRDMMPIEDDQAQMWQLNADRRSV